jgi:hypothetical protein
MPEMFKLVVTVPLTHSDDVRKALGDAGAGRIGNYGYCSFSVRGVGRFLPLQGATPYIGGVGQMEAVEEERIEVNVPGDVLPEVIRAMKAAHPYEEVAYDIYKLENADSIKGLEVTA